MNFIVCTQGKAGGRRTTSEGLEDALAVQYYGRMLFIRALEPLIRATALTEEVRILSILNSGNLPGYIDLDDLGLKNPSQSFMNIFKAILYYQDLMMDHFAEFYNNSGTAANVSCIHAYPGYIATGFGDELFCLGTCFRCINVVCCITKPEVCADYMVDNALTGAHMSPQAVVPGKTTGFHTMTNKGQVSG